MLYKRLYALLTILEAVLVLQASDWICMLVTCRAMGRWDLVLPADLSKRHRAMPCAMVVLTNVVGWYLLRRDDWRALRLQDQHMLTLLVATISAGIAYGYYKVLPSPSVGTACHQYCHDLTSEQEGDGDGAGRYRQG